MKPTFVFLFLLSLSSCRPAPARPLQGSPAPKRLLFSSENEDASTGDTITVREIWSLPAGQDMRNITVTYTKLGKARTTFQCNNAGAFEVRVVYQLQAKPERGGRWRIVQEKRNYSPGTCDGELPSFLGAAFQVLGDGGAEHRYLSLEQGKNARLLWAHTPTGSWMWRRTTPLENDEQKIEYEIWDLRAAADGSVEGYCHRMEIRQSTNEQTFACNGRTEITLFTRYRVVGRFLANGQVELRETGYVTQNRHPCDVSGKRYLDTYTGVLMGESMHLKTRGDDAEQVLTRRHGLE